MVIPEVGTYTFGTMCSLAGIKQAPKALTKTNIYEEIISSNKLLDDEPVPETGRVLVVTPATYLLMKQCKDITMETDIGNDMRIRGVIANLDGLTVMKIQEGIQVHLVGKIDKNIYKCITDDISTDEVIITDERIQHIMERHPNDYERYYSYLKEIVEHPQYIVETNKPYTALILKEFAEEEEQFKTVLRLTTSHDNPDFKNSIITFMKINDKEWKRMLKNKRILYKKG